ncbi:MAG: DUF2520 domain-containing protein [Pseudomonadota bacterium]
MKDLAIIGAGRLGISLASAFSRVGIDLVIGSRDIKSTRARLKDLTTENIDVTSASDAAVNANNILITVSDDQIQSVASELNSNLNESKSVAHCSGAHTAAILDKVLNGLTLNASIHPLNTFPSSEAGIRLLQNPHHATTCFSEGHPVALSTFEALFRRAGFHCERIDSDQKVRYHTACVMACNYLVALIDASTETAGLDPKTFQHALIPILQSTVENIAKYGTKDSLSGPIRRGDLGTIQDHFDALSGMEEESRLRRIYQALGAQAVTMVSSDLSEAAIDLPALTALFSEPDPQQ